MNSFWHNLTKPIIGLAPMDGVTDAPFRYIAAKYGNPDLIFTEFVSIDGIIRNVTKPLSDFLFHEIERPVIAQIYGNDPDAFYDVAFIVCELGFDGLDINMGCPAKSVAARGCGAGLIQTPDIAKKIVKSCQQAVDDWVDGKPIEKTRLGNKILAEIAAMKRAKPIVIRRKIPVSIKTRIGYDKIVIQDWIQHLLETNPAAITIHGRTLKQMYQGAANWDVIAEAASIIKPTNTLVLGNGDIQNLADAQDKINQTGVDGVLIGRAAFGNPWIFKKVSGADITPLRINIEPKPFEIFDIMLEHSALYENIKGNGKFFAMRKHLGWYCHGFKGAKELRIKMFQTNNTQEVKSLLDEFKNSL